LFYPLAKVLSLQHSAFSFVTSACNNGAPCNTYDNKPDDHNNGHDNKDAHNTPGARNKPGGHNILRYKQPYDLGGQSGRLYLHFARLQTELTSSSQTLLLKI
jgi:hypothetical protein